MEWNIPDRLQKLSPALPWR